MTTTPVDRPHKITAFYEVHHWPHQGKILIVNKEPWRDLPTLTWIVVAAGAGVARHDATVAVASALAAAVMFEEVAPSCVLHDRHGNMMSTPAGLGVPMTYLRKVG